MNDIIVSMHDICKSFPGVKALDHVDFELRSGEVMALLGENGAGKSTLMKVLSGVYTRDSGDMEIQGKAYGNLTLKQAQAAGVAIIHQELNMCRHLTVAENMFLGREKVRGMVLSQRAGSAQDRHLPPHGGGRPAHFQAADGGDRQGAVNGRTHPHHG